MFRLDGFLLISESNKPSIPMSMKSKLYQFIFMSCLGWRIEGKMNPKIKKCVIMVIPHTHWFDFFIGVFSRGIINQEMNYVAKKELFDSIIGKYFVWLGGAPLDRTSGLNNVQAIAKIFKERDVFRMAIAPEGTRKKVKELKSGFYYIAKEAEVPIIPVAFDYKRKVVSLGNYFYPTGNYEKDLPKLLEHFKGAEGKIKENGFEI